MYEYIHFNLISYTALYLIAILLYRCSELTQVFTENALIIDEVNNHVEIDKTFLYKDDLWNYFSASAMIDLKDKITDF